MQLQRGLLQANDWASGGGVYLAACASPARHITPSFITDLCATIRTCCQAVATDGGRRSAGCLTNIMKQDLHCLSSVDLPHIACVVSLQERLQQALMQWQHPAAPLPPALLAAQASGSTGAVAAAAVTLTAGAAAAAAAAGDRSKGDAAAVLLRERAQQWREALRGAFVALRHGHCPLVYVCGQVSS